MSTTRGVIFIHSAFAALCPHIEWAVGGVLGLSEHFDWTRQAAEPGTWRAEHAWTGFSGTSSNLAAALMRCLQLRFEVTEDTAPGADGQRFSYTPELGIFHAATNVSGDIVIPENRIRAALVADALGTRDLRASADELLGGAWDDELEVFRYAGADTPVRWLHAAV